MSIAVAPRQQMTRWFYLPCLWSALTGDQTDLTLQGWAWFFREHLEELARAMGPGLADATEKYESREKESREAGTRIAPKPALVRRLVSLRNTTVTGAVVMGPLGWVIAAVLILWEVLIR